jgi:hypothetical protein
MFYQLDDQIYTNTYTAMNKEWLWYVLIKCVIFIFVIFIFISLF